MVHAIVLIKVKRAEINNVANSLAELDGVSEVYSVGGRYRSRGHIARQRQRRPG